MLTALYIREYRCFCEGMRMVSRGKISLRRWDGVVQNAGV